MPPDERQIGGAFVLIGGKTEPLKEALDSSLQATTRTMQAMAGVAGRFSSQFGSVMGDAAQALTGPAGFVTAVAGMVKTIGDAEGAAFRLQAAIGRFSRPGEGAANAALIQESISQVRRGTSFTTARLQDIVATSLLDIDAKQVPDFLKALIGSQGLSQVPLEQAGKILSSFMLQGLSGAGAQIGALGVRGLPGGTVFTDQARREGLRQLFTGEPTARLRFQETTIGQIEVMLGSAFEAVQQVIGGAGFDEARIRQVARRQRLSQLGGRPPSARRFPGRPLSEAEMIEANKRLDEMDRTGGIEGARGRPAERGFFGLGVDLIAAMGAFALGLPRQLREETNVPQRLIPIADFLDRELPRSAEVFRDLARPGGLQRLKEAEELARPGIIDAFKKSLFPGSSIIDPATLDVQLLDVPGVAPAGDSVKELATEIRELNTNLKNTVKQIRTDIREPNLALE